MPGTLHIWIHFIFEQLCEEGALIIPIFKDGLNWRRDRLSKFAQGDKAREWQSWDANLESGSISGYTLNHYAKLSLISYKHQSSFGPSGTHIWLKMVEPNSSQ